MKNKIITQSISTLRIIAISSLTIFTLYTVQAWVSPTSSAPNGNVAGPITTSATAQTKAGNLTVGKLCLSGVCNASWPSTSGAVTSVNGQTGAVSIATGDNLGNHSATQSLSMNNQNIYSVGSFFHTVGNYLYLPAPYSPSKGYPAAADGKVLTSDAWGYATWQPPVVATGVTSITAGTGVTVSPAAGTGAVTVNATPQSSGLYACFLYQCYSACQLPGWRFSVQSSVPSGYTLYSTGTVAPLFANACYKL